MDFSSFNAAEQAHMTKIIEKKQVRFVFPNPFRIRFNTLPNISDARLSTYVRQPRGKVLQHMLQ